MIRIEENVSLKSLHTFGIDVSARYFCVVRSEDDVLSLLSNPVYLSHRVLILGGGSNLLFTTSFDGLIIKNELRGMKVTAENEETIDLEVASGENWHALVTHCVKNGWGGVENLSLIPGTVGAAPMQNIGAYGVEVKNVIRNVRAIDLKSGSTQAFSNDECHFGYRESVFKGALKEKFFISSVTLTLTKKNHHLNTQYGAIDDTLKQMNIITPSIQTISEAVIQIRQSKLPDPRVIGNAGSFFKNPTISRQQYDAIKNTHPLIPGYFSDNQEVKVPAGWLIEQCGMKGKRIGDAGVHAQQALVLVNYQNAKGEEIFSLAREIQRQVKTKFQIDLTMEVNIIS